MYFVIISRMKSEEVFCCYCFLFVCVFVFLCCLLCLYFVRLILLHFFKKNILIVVNYLLVFVKNENNHI